jgi:hypothetical protein
MFARLLGAVRTDFDRQIGWARNEIKRQTRHTALTAVLAGVAGLSALGAAVVGLIALHSWLALQYGPFVAHGTIGGSLLLIALILFTLAFVRQRPKTISPPRLQSAQPAALFGTLRQGSYDEAISIGERAFKAATTTLRDGDRTALLGTLALAVVVGLIAGRRL